MSNDNKTLADVQPGGMVRLGDALPPLPIRQRFTTLHGETYAYSAEQMQDYARAALAAQPSPGGQGGLNYERMFVDACAALAEVSRELGCDPEQGGAEPILAAIAELREALSARQPVGEPITVEAVAEIFNHPEYGLSIDWLLENGIGELQVGDVLMVSDRAITDEDGSGEVYAAPPAQAVDLGRWSQRHADDLHVAVHTALSVHAGSLSQKKRAAISAYVKRLLIDSQAVGK